MEWQQSLNYGVPMAILAAIGWASWKAARAVFDRLFAKDDGLVTKWTAATVQTQHRLQQYMDAEDKRAEQQIKTCEAHAAGLTAMAATLARHADATEKVDVDIADFRAASMDPDAPYSTVHTNRKLDQIHACIRQSCRAIAEIMDKQANKDLADEVKHNCEIVQGLLREDS